MTPVEAKEIIKKQERELDQSKRMNTQAVAQEYAYVHAKGYLEGYQAREKEVKALVEALEKANSMLCRARVLSCDSHDLIMPKGHHCDFRVRLEAVVNRGNLLVEELSPVQTFCREALSTYQEVLKP